MGCALGETLGVIGCSDLGSRHGCHAFIRVHQDSDNGATGAVSRDRSALQLKY